MLEKFIEHAQKHGPWIALMIYYFVVLNSQMKEIILLLQEQRHLLEIVAGIR